jgi:type IV pilus assembly protein PilB
VQEGHITEQQLRQALDVQARSHGLLGQILVDLGFVSAPTVGLLMAKNFGVEYVDLMEVRPDPSAVHMVPESVIRAMRVLPLRCVGETIEVAMIDPLNVAAIDTIHQHTNLRVVPYLTMAAELQRAINDQFDAHTRASEALQQLASEDAEQSGLSHAELVAASEAPIVRLVDSIIESALALRASDIHFEPHEGGLRVRFRVDGTLLDQTDIPRSQRAPLTARLKVLCQMDITENRRPQDGRMSYNEHGRIYDIRVSSVPTVFGEKIVLRILDKSSVMVPLGKLGFLGDQQRRFEGLIQQPHGMVIVVGPTGSGKSTTLYASLNLLNDSTRNIMTLEDPVEYHVQGINQVQVNQRIGLTFASGLRAFVRQDPDVILVGEIRDEETADMAVQASLTGHLVLSTLHTNSAVGTVARLTNLGVNPFLIAQSLLGVCSQRLVARICNHCATEYQPASDVLESVGLRPHEARDTSFRRGMGCRTCHGRGYLGRIGLYEVLTVNEEIRLLIMRGASEEEIQAAAERNGMMSLRDCAAAAVKAGITTPEEMGRVVLAKGG